MYASSMPVLVFLHRERDLLQMSAHMWARQTLGYKLSPLPRFQSCMENTQTLPKQQNNSIPALYFQEGQKQMFTAPYPYLVSSRGTWKVSQMTPQWQKAAVS